LVAVNEMDGVVDGSATTVVNNGAKPPADTELTVPDPGAKPPPLAIRITHSAIFF
jgi:hypothetical protein